VSTKPHLLYLAWGFPPAAKSCVYRKLATANSFVRAGWDVTVVTLTEDAWKREQGLDPSLLALVDPRIRVIRLPLIRKDIETDIRTYDEARALRPRTWLKQYYQDNLEQFPEMAFGGWRDALVEAVRDVQDERPADLLLTSGTPYTFFAPALDLYHRDGVPYIIDYRDAWAIDILKDRPGFKPGSRAAQFEQELLANALEAWFVNSPIRDAYAKLYPDASPKFHIVRNGSDVAIGTDKIRLRRPEPADGLTFGYLGTVTFGLARMRALCEGWRLARERSDVLRRSRLEFRGHMGTGALRGVTPQAAVIAEYGEHDVAYGGPVAKADTAAVYESWDALVLCLVGGRFVTSGKVFDYISTGLPVMSVHEWDHAAVEILEDYPLWVRNDGVDAEDVAEAFLRAERTVLAASIEDRLAARRHAEQYERYAQIQPAVDRLTKHVAPELIADGSLGTDTPGDPPPKVGEEVHEESPPPAPHARGETVLMAFTARPSEMTRRSIQRIRDAGARVLLMGPTSAFDADLAKVADSVILLDRATAPVSFDKSQPPQRFSPSWSALVARNLARRHLVGRYVRRVGGSSGWWLSAKRNRAAMAALTEATVLTSLDHGATYLIWNASRLNRTAPAIAGVGPTIEELGLTRV
jgi:hypothetical protein